MRGDVRRGLARATHTEGEERLSVSPLGRLLHGHRHLQGESVGLVRRRGAVRDWGGDSRHRLRRAAIAPGSYTGQNSQNGNGDEVLCPDHRWDRVELLDSGGRARLWRAAAWATDRLWIVKTAIGPDGSFTATTSQSGLFGSTGAQAKFTYSSPGAFRV